MRLGTSEEGGNGSSRLKGEIIKERQERKLEEGCIGMQAGEGKGIRKRRKNNNRKNNKKQSKKTHMKD